MQEEFNNHRLIFKSTPPAVNFNNLSIRAFPNIYMMSDIFGFYPYGEVTVGDKGGVIINNIVFVEGLKFEFKIGNDEEGYVGHDFFWSEDQINNIQLANIISGDNNFILQSNYANIDVTRSKAWSNQPLSTAVLDIVNNDFNITDTSKINIFNTTGSDTWYQINSKIRDFLWIHREQAYTSNYPYSPYITFINTNGEFYFTCFESLFNEHQPVANYKLSFSETSSIEDDVIQDYDIQFAGYPKNMFNYKKKLYKIGKTGAITSTDNNIENFLSKSGRDKVLIRQQLQEEYSDYELLGIQETTQDECRLNAKRNFSYIDSVLPVRMFCTINFNPKCVTGKLVDLQIESSMEDKQILSEFSGKWLIIADEHFMDYSGRPITRINIAKSKMNIDKNHPFYGDFLT